MAFTSKRNSFQIDHKTADEITVANNKTNIKTIYQPTPETLSSFAERTILHGVRFVFTGSIFMRLLWALILISSIGYCSYDAFINKSKELYSELFQRIHGGKVPKHDNIKMFGHQIEDMLLPSPVFDSCFINNMACGSDNFTAFFNSMYGQCHTFNSGHDDALVIDATAADDLNGLKHLLNVERNSYLDNPWIPIVGLRVLEHDQHTFPLMEEFGFAIHPGVHTLCSIKRKKVCSKV